MFLFESSASLWVTLIAGLLSLFVVELLVCGFPTQFNDYDDSDKTLYYLLHCWVAKIREAILNCTNVKDINNKYGSLCSPIKYASQDKFRTL